MTFACIRYVFKMVIKHLWANILVVGLETLKIFLTLNVAMMIRVTFSLPDSLKMSARTRITALPLLIQKHSYSLFIWYLTIMETLSWISRINPCNGKGTIKMKNLERNKIVSKIATSVGEDKRNNLLLSTELMEHESGYVLSQLCGWKRTWNNSSLTGSRTFTFKTTGHNPLPIELI